MVSRRPAEVRGRGMSGKISDQQAVEYALKLCEYCKSKFFESCKNDACPLLKVCGKPEIIESWDEILKGAEE